MGGCAWRQSDISGCIGHDTNMAGALGCFKVSIFGAVVIIMPPFCLISIVNCVSEYIFFAYFLFYVKKQEIFDIFDII